MTRAEIGAAYNVVQGHIRSPGKFEGEAIYVPHFWEVGLDGFADDETDSGDGPPVWWFDVTDDDRREFPELEHVARIGVWEDDVGFVRSEEIRR